jgi:hypothetical protein
VAVEVLTWVFSHSRSKNGERLVMLAVADACNSPDGTGAWMSNATLSAKTNLSERAVQESVRRCELLGELRVDRNAGRGGVNAFAVVMAEKVQNLHPAESAGCTDDKPAESAGGPNGGFVPGQRRKGAESAGASQASRGAESAPGTVSTKNSSTKSSVKTSGTKRAKKPEPQREDVDRVCNFLAEWRVKLGCPRPPITDKWRTEARLMIDKDGRSLEAIKEITSWSQRNSFWRSNIKSIPKLRDQFDTLRLQKEREDNPTSNGGGYTSGGSGSNNRKTGYQPWHPPEDPSEYHQAFSGAKR